MSIPQPAPITDLARVESRRSTTSSVLVEHVARPWLATAVLLVGDFGALALSALVSVLAWRHVDARLSADMYARLMPVLLLFILAYASSGLYPGFGRSPIEELRKLSASTSLVYAALAVTVFLLKDAAAYSRAVFLLGWIQSIATVPLSRALVRFLYGDKPWWGDEVAVIGEGEAPCAVAQSLASRTHLGLKPLLVLSQAGRKLDLIDVQGIRHAILVASPNLPLAETYEELSQKFLRVTVLPELSGLSSLWIEARDLGGVLGAGMIGLEIRQRLLMPGVWLIKRLVDLCIVLLTAVVVLPLVALIAIAIKLNSRGSVFYGQLRYGRGGKPFVAWKFRSMVANAGEVLEECLRTNPALRAEWNRDHKLRCDPRVTAVGRVLRKTSLDELPQIWNVLVGEMSIVGPRPIVHDEIRLYGKDFALYQQVTPGLTGMWQVSGRNDLTYDQRVECDLFYIRNWSPWLDLYILARTVTAVLLARGAY
jgi:Undecaprenyl-phosphate galactose phosphotransferase WbaP